MKRKCDGWHGNEFHCNGTVFHKVDQDEFDFRVREIVRCLKGTIRPGKIDKRGQPLSGSTFSRWLVDVCNHLVFGNWQDLRISEAHLNAAAKVLGYPEKWIGGDVSYCVKGPDLYFVESEIAIHAKSKTEVTK